MKTNNTVIHFDLFRSTTKGYYVVYFFYGRKRNIVGVFPIGWSWYFQGSVQTEMHILHIFTPMINSFNLLATFSTKLLGRVTRLYGMYLVPSDNFSSISFIKWEVRLKNGKITWNFIVVLHIFVNTFDLTERKKGRKVEDCRGFVPSQVSSDRIYQRTRWLIISSTVISSLKSLYGGATTVTDLLSFVLLKKNFLNLFSALYYYSENF